MIEQFYKNAEGTREETSAQKDKLKGISIAEIDAELMALRAFKEGPYWRYFAAWMDAQVEVIVQGVAASSDQAQTHKLSGGLRVLQQLKQYVNSESALMDARQQLVDE